MTPTPEREGEGLWGPLPLKVVDWISDDAVLILHPETKIDPITGHIVNANRSVALRGFEGDHLK